MWNLFKVTGVFIVNLDQISHIVLVILLLTLKKQKLAGNIGKEGQQLLLKKMNQNFPQEEKLELENTTHHNIEMSKQF